MTGLNEGLKVYLAVSGFTTVEENNCYQMLSLAISCHKITWFKLDSKWRTNLKKPAKAAQSCTSVLSKI